MNLTRLAPQPRAAFWTAVAERSGDTALEGRVTPP
jgi:hypothetical protein